MSAKPCGGLSISPNPAKNKVVWVKLAPLSLAAGPKESFAYDPLRAHNVVLAVALFVTRHLQQGSGSQFPFCWGVVGKAQRKLKTQARSPPHGTSAEGLPAQKGMLNGIRILLM